jgi:hypothetical protein
MLHVDILELGEGVDLAAIVDFFMFRNGSHRKPVLNTEFAFSFLQETVNSARNVEIDTLQVVVSAWRRNAESEGIEKNVEFVLNQQNPRYLVY